MELLSATPSKPRKRHNGSFYWLTRDGDPVPVALPPGPEFGVIKLLGRPGFSHFTYTHFSGCRHRRILPTQTFRVAVTVAFAFYLHTFLVAGVLHFTYTHFRGRFLRKIDENDVKFEKIPRCARSFSYAINKKMRYTLKHFSAARGLLLTQSIRK